MSRTVSDHDPDDAYEHLKTKRKECEGTVEPAEIVDVRVGQDRVTLRCAFDWTTQRSRVQYDLDDERDVYRLELLCEAQGFDFEQVTHLEGEVVELRYTGTEWVPTAHEVLAEGQGSPTDTFRTELEILVQKAARSPRVVSRAIDWARDLSMQQTVVAVIVVKKILILILLAAVIL